MINIKPPSESLTTQLKGWFALCQSDALKVSQEIEGWLCDKPYRLYRTFDGKLHFNGSDQRVCEQNGIIIVWHDPENTSPGWTLPIVDENTFLNFRFKELQVNTHPQEVFENSIDFKHFAVVHDFPDIEVVKPPVFDQHNMTVQHQVSRKDPFSLTGKKLTSRFEVKLHGIGCTYNTIEVTSMGLMVKMLVFVTPTQKRESRIFIGVAINKPASFFKKLIQPIMQYVITNNIVHDFSQDIAIWENKRYQSRPLLVKGDGPIIQFRRWCQQFKSE